MRIAKISVVMLSCAVGALAFSPARAEMDQQKGPQARIERMCADQGKSEKFTDMQAKRADRLAEKLKLTDAQKAAFKDLQDARAKARADSKTALCASKPDLSTFDKKLEFHEAMMQRRLDTLKAIAPKLIAFRNTLDDKQKEQFDHVVHHMMMRGGMGHGWGHHEGMGEGHHDHHHHHHDD